MNTLKLAFGRMKENSRATLKLIIAQIVLGVVMFVISLIPFIQLLTLPLALYNVAFLYGAYWDLFVEDFEGGLDELFLRGFDRFKAKWGKILLLLFCFAVIAWVLVLALMFGGGAGLFFALISGELGVLFGSLGLVILALFLMMSLSIYSIYALTSIVLDVPSPIKGSFRYWKHCLLLALIFAGLSIIPLIGWLGLIVVQFITPLKVILDLKESELN